MKKKGDFVFHIKSGCKEGSTYIGDGEFGYDIVLAQVKDVLSEKELLIQSYFVVRHLKNFNELFAFCQKYNEYMIYRKDE